MLARRGEIAVRLARGAGRARLARQVLVEALVLSGIAALLGVLLAHATLPSMVAFSPTDIARQGDTRVDDAVLGFGMLLAVGTAVALALVPPGRSGTAGMRTRSAKPAPSRLYSGWRPVNRSSGTALEVRRLEFVECVSDVRRGPAGAGEARRRWLSGQLCNRAVARIGEAGGHLNALGRGLAVARETTRRAEAGEQYEGR